MGIGAIVLAAGGSSRLGVPKQLLEFHGESLVRRAAKAALESVCDRVVIVIGNHAQLMRQEIGDLPVSVVENKIWQSGISSSIRAGLEKLSSQGGIVITLCDQPFVTAALLTELISTHCKTRRPIVASTYGTTRGVPAFFAPELFSELASLTKDEGARRIIALHPEKVATVEFPRGAIDIDTTEDLARLIQT
ncbi:MAG TPA: nucleotidyltransferase family protein [Pyrinomonadaceae bacterium]|nr:nucleotidyltransferase family protein [Pyrinomonadaceae bacterium]